VTPGIAIDALDAFERELLAGGIATQVLERRAVGKVRAEAVGESSVAVDADVRALLACAANDAVAHRETRLMAGDAVLSDADLWYLPARLTAQMNHALAVGDTPFGAVIRALSPTRRTLSSDRPGSAVILHVRAIVLDGAGRPLALADERYRKAALG
jgi:chorismate-pyruvate lyase